MSTVRLLAFVFSIACLIPAARADDIDTVTLTNGTILRGHVAELIPGQTIRLQLMTGDERVVPFADVMSVAGPSFPKPEVAPPPVLAPTEDGASWRAPGPGKVPVELTSRRSDHPQNIQLAADTSFGVINGRGVSWQRYVSVCTTPCTLYVQPGPLALLLTGGNVWAHYESLSIAPTGSSVQLRAPDRATTTAGGMLTVLGGLTAVTGGPVLIVLGTVQTHTHETIGTNGFPTLTTTKGDAALRDAGYAVLGIGSAAMVAGIVILATARGGTTTTSALDYLQGRAHF